MNFRKLAILATAVFALSLAANADTLYTQTFDQTGNFYSSQNDTGGGNGLFAQVYDNFKVSSDFTATEVQFVGGYFNPPAQGQITGWTIQVYADAAGQPGSLLSSTAIAGTGGETFLGNFGGFPAYSYDIAGLNFAGTAGTQYWLSVYPDLAFPPQWGWGSASGGDGVSYQDFFGTRSQLAADMAFTVIGTTGGGGGVPEPGTLVMLGTGALGLAGAIRRKLF
jgi:hypothetical protein